MLYEFLQNISFANVWVLPLLVLLPVLVWLHFSNGGKMKSSFTVSSAQHFKHRTAKNFFIHLPFWLRLLALGCLVLALARPQIRDVQNRAKGEGIDIVLCLDVSTSMYFRDFKPNRIEAAREVVTDFVQSRPVDRIGLVVFAGESYTLSPLTTNHNLILQQVKSMTPEMLKDAEGGTLIGEGLAKSVERLASVSSKSKVVVLMTDGKENPPRTRIIDPVTALQIAKAKGVRIYTVGIAGTPDEQIQANIPVTERTSNLDDALLQRMATETGGAYFKASDKETLQMVYSQIDKLEKSSFERITKTRVEEQYFYLVIAALGLLLLEAILRYTWLRSFP